MTDEQVIDVQMMNEALAEFFDSMVVPMQEFQEALVLWYETTIEAFNTAIMPIVPTLVWIAWQRRDGETLRQWGDRLVESNLMDVPEARSAYQMAVWERMNPMGWFVV